MILYILCSATFLIQTSTSELSPTEITSKYNDYRVLAQCEEFEMYPQANKILVKGDKFVFNRGFDPNMLLLVLDSQDDFNMKKIQVNSSNTDKILLENSNFKNVTMSSHWMILNLDSATNAYLFTEKTHSVGGNVSFDGMTDFELRLPKNDFEMIFEVPEKTRLNVDDKLTELTEKSKIKIDFDSDNTKSIFFKRELDISASPVLLSSLRIAEPVNLLLNKCVGTLSMANPPATYEMHGSGSFYIETIYADLQINWEKAIQVDSSGNAEKILINGMEPWLYQILSELTKNSLGITIGVVGVIAPMLGFIMKFRKARIRKHPLANADIDSAWKDFQWVFWPFNGGFGNFICNCKLV